jgi:cell division septation protein DedD
MPNIKSVNAQMQQIAEYAVKVAAEKFDQSLDYTENSLANFEVLLLQAHEQYSSQVSRKNFSQEAIQKTARVWGSYLGELMRRKWGGEWVVSGTDVKLMISGKSYSPIQQVYQRITMEQQYDTKKYIANIASDMMAYGGANSFSPVFPSTSSKNSTGNKIIKYIANFWRSGQTAKIEIVTLITLVLALSCCCIFSILTIKTQTSKATATSTIIPTSVIITTPTLISTPTISFTPSDTPTLSDTPTPSNTPQPTSTPKPTNTPQPTSTPKPTNTPTKPPAGESRDNPIPAGTTVDIGGNMALTIVSAIRPADSIVSNGNMFNTKPEANQEYLQVNIQVVCNKSSNDTCYFDPYEIKAVGADGNIHDEEIFIAGVDGLIESGDFFGGGTRVGKMFFIVPKGDNSVVLFHEPFLFGSRIYLALP